MEQNRPSATIEDYLGVIYTLNRDGERVIAARLAEYLDVSAPTVTATLRRMQRDGWVSFTAEKEIFLTAMGQSAAMSVIKRHMLTEWMLSRMLKLPLSELHREAHHIEHTLSPEVADRLQAEMDAPRVCPHGNPLPGYEEEVQEWLPLSEASPDQEVTLMRIQERIEGDYEMMTFLESKGLIPGAILQVREVLPFNETISVCVNGQEVILGLRLADEINVSLMKGREK
jgi:DtxR family Mn-dependent transcriptional regulator